MLFFSEGFYNENYSLKGIGLWELEEIFVVNLYLGGNLWVSCSKKIRNVLFLIWIWSVCILVLMFCLLELLILLRNFCIYRS